MGAKSAASSEMVAAVKESLPKVLQIAQMFASMYMQRASAPGAPDAPPPTTPTEGIN